MDQQKIGTFLKQLRQERQLTQENLAEIMCVTNRSVSRWENGVNLPDLPTLIQLADFYGVELRELLDGERKPDAMNTPETKSDPPVPLHVPDLDCHRPALPGHEPL